jgi:hypothetical protein
MNISNDVLAKGIAQGIITTEQAARLRALDDPREPLEIPASPDDEQLRFISGFSDIFVTIGLAMFIGATGYFAFRANGNVAMWASIAIVAWLLAEFFTRMRRMALPSIVLLIVFSVSVFACAALLLGAGYIRAGNGSPGAMASVLGLDPRQPTMLALAALVTVVLTAAHYWRFRVPITIAAGCAALVIAAVGLAYGFMPQLSAAGYNLLILICGLVTFALAMRFDMSDPERLTRRTDIAFWLHLLAAPLIVHSLIRGLVGISKLDIASAAAIIAVFLVLSLIAILIDRRAMLVSGLSYAGYAFSTLIREAGFSDMTTPATILALGAFVLLLSAGWRPLRTAILNVTPSAIAQRLPKTSQHA